MKKLTLVAAMAMAVAAFAVPSTASAQWTHNHKHLVGNAQIHGVGSANFQSGIGGVNCASNVTATATLTGGTTTASVTQFSPVVADCDPTGGINHCTIDNIDVELTPYQAHINGTHIQPTNVRIQNTLSGFICPDITISGNGVTIIPHDTDQGAGGHTTITALTLSGQLESSAGGNVTVGGTITATASSSHTYGFT